MRGNSVLQAAEIAAAETSAARPKSPGLEGNKVMEKKRENATNVHLPTNEESDQLLRIRHTVRFGILIKHEKSQKW